MNYTHKAIENEIFEELDKLCAEHIYCENCPHNYERQEYGCGCWGKIAIEKILQARAQGVKK